MKIWDVSQGTTEWLMVRAGIPTASGFNQILTPGGKISTQAEKYQFGLLAERMMKQPRVEAVTMWMERGSDMERDAVSWYEFERDCDTVPVGFITNDPWTIGASPDRLCGENGLLEIKCPSEAVHVSYLLKKGVDAAYYPQVQGQLWITGRQWVDIVSFHPLMRKALIRVERDEGYIRVLSGVVETFSEQLEEQSRILEERGWIEPNWNPLRVRRHETAGVA